MEVRLGQLGAGGSQRRGAGVSLGSALSGLGQSLVPSLASFCPCQVLTWSLRPPPTSPTTALGPSPITLGPASHHPLLGASTPWGLGFPSPPLPGDEGIFVQTLPGEAVHLLEEPLGLRRGDPSPTEVSSSPFACSCWSHLSLPPAGPGKAFRGGRELYRQGPVPPHSVSGTLLLGLSGVGLPLALLKPGWEDQRASWRRLRNGRGQVEEEEAGTSHCTWGGEWELVTPPDVVL